MKNPFKVGDKVVVIEGGANLPEGAIRTITFSDERGVSVIPNAKKWSWYPDRFKLYEPKPSKESIIEVKKGQKLTCINDGFMLTNGQTYTAANNQTVEHKKTLIEISDGPKIFRLSFQRNQPNQTKTYVLKSASHQNRTIRIT